MTTPTPNELARVAARRGITLGYEIARFDREWVQQHPASTTDDVGGSEYIGALASHLSNIFSLNRSAGNVEQASLSYSEAREIAEWRFPYYTLRSPMRANGGRPAARRLSVTPMHAACCPNG